MRRERVSDEDGTIWARWAEVDRIFATVLDAPLRERERRVAAEAGGDVALFRAVMALLGDAEAAEARVRGPGARLLRAWTGAAGPAPEASLEPGTHIGRYRVLGELGRGGMATVFEAERADGVYRQRVALKLLRRGLDTEEVVRRFIAEREILSALSHPNIASLLDGGSTADGRPYLVMEKVDGQPITGWAEERELGTAPRLRLFLQVAEAVGFAHRHLVIHRDIKPSNVLVGPEGRVRLLDFGIAKLLDPETAPDGGASTRTGLLPLTPAYASPEQLRGGQVTTASDVFQLGGLLYRLLSGERPFDLRQSDAREGNAAPDPPAPSVVAARGGRMEAARSVKGDLDTIVLRALRSDPAERYPSVEAMADDVKRHLEGRPIEARPASPGYRARKFMRRNRWVAPVATVAVLAVSGYIATLEVQSRRLEQERNEARTQAERARELKRFLVGLFEAADPYADPDPDRGRRITAAEALALGADRARDQLSDRPALRADLLGTVGAAYDKLDVREPALELLEEAIGLRASLGDGASPAQMADLGSLASVLARTGRTDSARAVYSRQLALARELDDGLAIADALLGLGIVEWQEGRFDRAHAFRAEAVALLRAAGPDAGPGLAAALVALGDSHRVLDRLDSAETALREALDIHGQVHGDRHPATALARVSLAALLQARGRLQESAGMYRAAIERLEETLGPLHFNTINATNNLGIVLGEAGELEAAEATHRLTLERRRAVPGGDSLAVAASLQNLAAVLLRLDRLAEADSSARAAAALYRDALPAGHYLQGFPLLTRLEIHLRQGDGRGAERLARQALGILEPGLPEGHFATAVARCRLGLALALQDRAGEAEPLMASALAVLREAETAPAHLREECAEGLDRVTPEREG